MVLHLIRVFTSFLYSLNMYPYFNISHYILVCLLTKDRFSKEDKNFSRLFPLAHYVLTMVLIFAGSIIINLLFGDSLTTVLDNSTAIFHASICWYLINYSPGNLIYKICKFKAIFVIVCLMKEIHRSKSIVFGIDEAAIRYPNSLLIWIIVGTIKGNATNQFAFILDFFLKNGQPLNHELMNPSFVSKISFLLSFAYSVNNISNYVSVQVALMVTVMILIYFRSLILFKGNSDPLRDFHNIMCFIFLGGLTDEITLFIQKKIFIKEEMKKEQ